MKGLILWTLSLFLTVTFSKTVIRGSGSSAAAQAMAILATSFNSGSTDFEIQYTSTG
jgi:ABC-type phosphate transport system substrate-binding protein